ncbi:MAG: hypothetical protein ACLPKB_18475 [Xanthobacteraceae bacterium]
MRKPKEISHEARAHAEERFKKKEERAREGAKAAAEYQANIFAVRERTARLRALRLSTAAEKAIITPNYRASGISAGHEGLGDPSAPMGRKARVKARSL